MSHIQRGRYTASTSVLVDIRIKRVCCHSNETRAPIANPPNSAQLEDMDTHYHSAKVTYGFVQ